MRIGIDISQIVYEGTGVSKYVKEMVRELISRNSSDEFVLFGASFRKNELFTRFFDSLPKKNHVTLRVIRIPPTLMDFLWNILHVFPIELLIGKVDVFWSSDWTQPPLLHAVGLTTIHDVSFLRYPDSFAQHIVNVQKRRIHQAQKECTIFLCDSEATKQDCMELLGMKESTLRVVYPGFSL